MHVVLKHNIQCTPRASLWRRHALSKYGLQTHEAFSREDISLHIILNPHKRYMKAAKFDPKCENSMPSC
jgi:hypothetical protein